ncbi:hypothetical protein M231_07550 [Tremella mesenterica]|uniref:Uncharacterized protein n=1 Tax=Tremella mesenterica TaxID=5217 RepID=A0A4Q1B8U0_TREME|nr:uncharacterized protein TREMEDRAFT_60454 [Tremella mesenterica DSM 1558]EIW71528.1 hypothetical protein TREMEDRAFT_60454 [Tremella mesenterica DSM 1558]RXK35179.1 hypothetical protein M231_07550 [Tremella mesenterica]
MSSPPNLHSPSEASLIPPSPSILLNPIPSSPLPRRSPSETGSTGSRNKIKFAPLPQVPELKRRSSITLGVAARKNLLHDQSQKKSGVVYMSDEDWERYKKDYESDSVPVVDLGQLAKESARSLWRKMRTSSTSSTISNLSTLSDTSDTSIASTSFTSPRRSNRRLSAPDTPADIPILRSGLGTVEEEVKHLVEVRGRPHSPVPIQEEEKVVRTRSPAPRMTDELEGKDDKEQQRLDDRVDLNVLRETDDIEERKKSEEKIVNETSKVRKEEIEGEGEVDRDDMEEDELGERDGMGGTWSSRMDEMRRKLQGKNEHGGEGEDREEREEEDQEKGNEEEEEGNIFPSHETEQVRRKARQVDVLGFDESRYRS